MSEPIRLFHIIDGLRVGGAETLMYNLVSGLPRDSFQVTVGYSTPGPYIEDLTGLGVPLIHFPRIARIDPLLMWRMYKAIREIRPHIVHTHLFKSDVHGRPAARLAGVPVVVSALQNCDNWARNPVLGRLYGLTARFADKLIAASEEVRQFEIRHTGVPSEQVVTIPNAVPVDRFQGNEAAGLALRSEFGIPVGIPLIGIVARLMPQKDHATFLDAAALVLREVPEARFLIVGVGPLQEALQVQIQQLGIAESVIFTGLRKDIPAVMAAIDILTFSSRWEGLPVAMLEGMASGTSVVATAVDGIPGVITDGVHGLLVPPQSPKALATALVQLCQNPRLRKQIGMNAAMHVEANYSNKATLRKTVALYNELLKQHDQSFLSPGIAL